MAFAFGLALLGMAYTIGHVSGCHINPAVTLGFWLSRKITSAQAVWYWVAQLIGAFIGGLIIFIISDAGDLDQTRASSPQTAGVTTSGATSGSASTIVVEIIFTALLVFVVLSTTTDGLPDRLRRTGRRPHTRR